MDEAQNLVAHTLCGEGFDASEDGTGRGTPIVAVDLAQITSKANRSHPTAEAPPLNTTGNVAVLLADEPRVFANTAGDTALGLSLPGVPPLTRRNGDPGTVFSQTIIPRRLTPSECETLMGWPRGWTDVNGMKDSPRYRMIGNGVVKNVAEWIGRRIVAADSLLRNNPA